MWGPKLGIPKQNRFSCATAASQQYKPKDRQGRCHRAFQGVVKTKACGMRTTPVPQGTMPVAGSTTLTSSRSSILKTMPVAKRTTPVA